ncbi:C6 transcription factor, putative [Rhizoctonia solani]|uniref:C6 transcription factor, putative n=1 Tax=Rhizoctonia solani TaxID=456999 RepID=A0A0K6GG31_9AGAM|nr:C6 transcription factor, putative [Rhizoctonia solani]
MELARQRSRKGCLTCRQKRKKCDETKPVCGRCQGGDECIWPVSRPPQKTASRSSRMPRIQPRPSNLKLANISVLAETATPVPGGNKPIPNAYSQKLNPEFLNMFLEAAVTNDPHDFVLYDSANFAPTILNTLMEPLEPSILSASILNTFRTQEHSPESRYSPLLSDSDSSALPRIMDEPDHTLDEDEEDTFKTTDWLPGALQLFNLHLFLELPSQDQVRWSSVIDSYFRFFVRYSYDPSNIPIHMCDFVARHLQLESVRLAVLGTSLVFYSFLNPGLPQGPLWRHANEFINAAATALQVEEFQPNTTLNARLAGISELLGYYYYIGDLGGYIRCIEQALPIVQKLVGTTPASIHKLYGSETLNIRLFAWCDVFSAIATSRPTRLVYDCNVDALLQRNQAGPDAPLLDSGLEWMAGFPDAFLLLTMQILNLKHTSMSPAERISQATAIEAALRGWKVWPSDITNSTMRIQRVSAQEVWRHFTILYLYQAVHQATPSQEVVQQSVKQIIKLASTLRPGHNPDCLLYIPYFLAGTFAISPKNRWFIRDRLMRCSVGTYMKGFVDALDELWKGCPIDKYIDWTSRSPPLVMF